MSKVFPILVLMSFLAIPAMTLATTEQPVCGDTVCEGTENTSSCPGDCAGAPTVVTDVTGLINKINTIGNYIFMALMAVASVFMIYAGFMWVTAGGNPEGATKARQMLINAVIGVAVALLARGLVQVINSIIRG